MANQGEIALSKKEQLELNILAKFRNGDITRARAAEIPGLSERQVTRKSSQVAKEGVRGVLHGNSGKPPENKTSLEIKARFFRILQEHVF